MTMMPLVSIIIPAHNAKRFLRLCLQSILVSNYNNYEIIIVDNGSTDNTADCLSDEFSSQLGSRLKFIKLSKNYGPARARNIGVAEASGEYFCFLDSDTQVDEDWLTSAIVCFQNDEDVGAIQCKLLQKDRKSFDYAGEYITNLGFLVSVAKHGELDKGQYDSVRNILAAKSAGMLISKEAFNKAGGFDDDYFIFVEETDLGWRCWLSGYRVVFCPESVVYHHFSASRDIFSSKFNNYIVRFHGTKNYILTLLKNLGLWSLVKILPVHILLWLGLCVYLLVRGNFSPAVYTFYGILWNIVHLPKTLCKRINIQKSRVWCDTKLLSSFKLMKRRSVVYYVRRYISAQRS